MGTRLRVPSQSCDHGAFPGNLEIGKPPVGRPTHLQSRDCYGSGWAASQGANVLKYGKFIPTSLRALMAAWLTVCTLAAAEHHGTVKFATLPVAGATVTLTQADKKMMAVTDLDGI